jgi:hypothetical protein
VKLTATTTRWREALAQLDTPTTQSPKTGAGDWPFFLAHNEAILSLCEALAILVASPIDTSSDASFIVVTMHSVFSKIPCPWQQMVLEKSSKMFANNYCGPLLVLVQPTFGGKSAV